MKTVSVNQAWKDAPFELTYFPELEVFKNPYPYRFATMEDCQKAAAAMHGGDHGLFLSLTVPAFIEK